MAKKKTKAHVEGDQKNNNGNENKKEEKKDGSDIIVLKTDLHCDGCASKVVKCLRSLDGVNDVKIGEGHIISVTGKVDPVKLREKLEQKTHKKFELISPLPKKDKKNDNKETDKGKENKADNGLEEKKKKQESKEKQLPVTTAILKVHLHCEGCIQKIHKIVTKTKGCEEMKLDRNKELVTITGAMDMKSLADTLKKHLKRDVQILPPPKKETEKKEKGEKKSEDGGKKGDSYEAEVVTGGGGNVDFNRMQVQVGFPYPFMHGPGPMLEQFPYNPYTVGPVHAPQLFSDENPNACSVM